MEVVRLDGIVINSFLLFLVYYIRLEKGWFFCRKDKVSKRFIIKRVLVFNDIFG